MAKDKKPQVVGTLADLLKSIDKEFGVGTTILGNNAVVNVEAFSTNVASFDLALGIGGIPIGRLIEIYGPESGGKTTTCLQIIKACQQHFFKNKNRHGVTAFIDAENALDKGWATKIGVDTSKLIIAQPESAEDTFEIAIKMAESGLVDLIVVDSVAALLPKEMLEGEMGDANMGALSRVMSKGLTKLKSPCNKNGTTIIFINQIREKLGVMFGNPETTPGGKSLKFYASVRVEIKKLAPIKEKDSIYAFRTRAKVVKNKVAPPFEEGEFDICVGKPPRQVFGIDEAYSLVEVALECGVCTRKGNFIHYADTSIGNGILAAVEIVRKNDDLFNALKSTLYDKMKANVDLSVLSSIEEDDLMEGLEDGILDKE
jgi:recombination protein RecA